MTTLRDSLLLLARVGLGLVLVVHGWQKVQQGVGATAEGFAAMGIPAAEAAAVFAMVAEVGGGALIALGLLTPVAGVLVALQMAGAFWFAHRGTAVLVTEGGFELVLVIGLLALVLAVVGAGRFSADHALLARRRGGTITA